jgi:hypothetical protein
MGRHRLVVKDKKYREFKVLNLGGRLHRNYLRKNKRR